MFIFLHEDFIKHHLKDDTLKLLEKSSETRMNLFYSLTVGVNVLSLDTFQTIAEWILAIPEENLKIIKMDDVIKGVGNYIDESGYMV